MGSSKEGSGSSEEPGSAQLGLGALIGIPWLMFSILCGLFAFVYHHYALVVWAIISLWFLLAFLFMVLDARNRMGGSWFLLLGMLCVAAAVNGSIAGQYNYWTNMYPYWSYYEHSTYTNVLPTASAISHSDAGKIVFASTARVDTSRALGYKQGTVYCVAPILDDHQVNRVEYWAAGVDCCNSRGDFACDDTWDPTAKSGLVLPAFMGATVSMANSDIGVRGKWWRSTRDRFIQAVKMAEASYDLKSAENPLLVQWIANPQRYTDDLWRHGVGHVVGSISVYFLLSLIFGAGFQAFSKRAAAATQKAPTFSDA
jgi:hypothetical protein